MEKYSMVLLISILSIAMFSLFLVGLEVNILKLNEAEAITFMNKPLEENMTMVKDSNQTAIESPIDKKSIKFLGVQHAQSGALSEINSTTYLLELNDVADKIILFADRPNRIVKSESTLDFVGNWSVGADSFAVDAPNAVLIVDDRHMQDTSIIELFNPVYDVNKKTLKYEIVAENATSIDLPNEFGRSTLVIDC